MWTHGSAWSSSAASATPSSRLSGSSFDPHAAVAHAAAVLNKAVCQALFHDHARRAFEEASAAEPLDIICGERLCEHACLGDARFVRRRKISGGTRRWLRYLQSNESIMGA